MIVEVRSYRIKPGRRAEFIKLFETRAIPALRSYGMTILGPLLDVENPKFSLWYPNDADSSVLAQAKRQFAVTHHRP